LIYLHLHLELMFRWNERKKIPQSNSARRRIGRKPFCWSGYYWKASDIYTHIHPP
jgi:hypothetical protein